MAMPMAMPVTAVTIMIPMTVTMTMCMTMAMTMAVAAAATVGGMGISMARSRLGSRPRLRGAAFAMRTRALTAATRCRIIIGTRGCIISMTSIAVESRCSAGCTRTSFCKARRTGRSKPRRRRRQRSKRSFQSAIFKTQRLQLQGQRRRFVPAVCRFGAYGGQLSSRAGNLVPGHFQVTSQAPQFPVPFKEPRGALRAHSKDHGRCV